MKKHSRKAPNRLRKPTNVTLDPLVKEQAKKLAGSEATDLSGLVTTLLVERLKAAGMWPPPETDATPKAGPSKPRPVDLGERESPQRARKVS